MTGARVKARPILGSGGGAGKGEPVKPGPGGRRVNFLGFLEGWRGSLIGGLAVVLDAFEEATGGGFAYARHGLAHDVVFAFVPVV